MTSSAAIAGLADWPVRSLGDLGRLLHGVGYDPDRHLVASDGPATVRLLRANNVQESTLDLTDLQRVVDSCVAPDQFMRPGDVLICAANGNKALVGKAAPFEPPDTHRYTFGAFMTCFRPDPALIDPHFAAYLFQSDRYRGQVAAAFAGSSINNLGPGQIGGMTFALPSAREQAAIVEVLGDVDRLLRSLGQLIAKKRDVRRAITHELLTGRQRLPGFEGEWAIRRLGDVVAFLATANNPRADLSAIGDVLYVHYGDVHASAGPFLDATTKHVPAIPAKKVQGIPRLGRGDLVMVDASEDYDGLGKSVEIAETGGREIVAGLHTIALRGDLSALADGFKGYLQFIPALRTGLRRGAAGISVYGVSKSTLAAIELPLPSVPEQRAIARVLADIDIEIGVLERGLSKTRLLKEAMAHELLSGRVRLRVVAETLAEALPVGAEARGVAPAVA